MNEEKKVLHEKHEVAPDNSEALKDTNEKLEALVEEGRGAKNEHAEKIDELRNEAKHEAKTRDEVLAKQAEQEPQAEVPTLVNRELKGMAYKRTLTRIRKDLPAPERVFSRLIHNPVVESVSEVGSKTVARPSGVLAGGFFAFLGSSVFLWVAKHYGYEYNFLLFAAFFVGGFALGLVVELIFRTFKKAPKS